jgi:hypothetical protein
LVLDRLVSWTTFDDPAARFFSGTARYRKEFELPPGWRGGDQKTLLDLGHLWTIAEVRLNGTNLGILWTPPFTLDCTEALKDAKNELAVDVTNTWYNRLIGDAGLPPGERLTRTNVPTSGGKPWAELEPLGSGLLGPVRLMALAEMQVK